MEREKQEQEETYEPQKIQNKICWKFPFKLLFNLFIGEEGRIQALGLFPRPHLLFPLTECLAASNSSKRVAWLASNLRESLLYHPSTGVTGIYFSAWQFLHKFRGSKSGPWVDAASNLLPNWKFLHLKFTFQ